MRAGHPVGLGVGSGSGSDACGVGTAGTAAACADASAASDAATCADCTASCDATTSDDASAGVGDGFGLACSSTEAPCTDDHNRPYHGADAHAAAAALADVVGTGDNVTYGT